MTKNQRIIKGKVGLSELQAARQRQPGCKMLGYNRPYARMSATALPEKVAKKIDTCAEEADRSMLPSLLTGGRSEAEGTFVRQLATAMDKR